MANMSKKEIIQGFETLIQEGFMLSPESIQVLKYVVTNYNKSARNVSMEECSEVISDLKNETGFSLSQLLDQIKEVKNEDEDEDEDEVLDDEATEEPEQVVVDLKSVKSDKAKLPVKPTAKVENSDKKVIKPKATEPKAEPVKEEAPKKASKIQVVSEEALEMFPEELYSETLKGTMKLRNDITTIEEFAEAINDKQEDLVLVTFWTKTLLKKYASSYDPYGINPSKPKEFPDNLDIIEVTHASNLVVTGISIYSNVPQVILPGDFEIHDNNIRYANGCELQVYQVFEDEEVTE